MMEGKLYFVKAEYAPNVVLTNTDNLFEVLDHLVEEGHAVVLSQVRSKFFFGMPQMMNF